MLNGFFLKCVQNEKGRKRKKSAHTHRHTHVGKIQSSKIMVESGTNDPVFFCVQTNL